MEDDPDDHTSSAVVPSPPPLKNGEKPPEDMANFPNTDENAPSLSKVNGSVNPTSGEQEDKDRDSSDCDALVIDEGSDPTTVTKKPKLDNDGGEEEEFRHTNPYFSESIFDLSTQYRPQRPPKGNGKKLRGKNGKPKLREYAQYLGLQPTVQFKCSKCFMSGFQSLQVLNEHHSTCTAPPVSPPAIPFSNKGTNIRVTRKVFLCSACGTYYENWNLFLHMREVHKRYICLYCLGMFPHAEKLSVHLISKHNCNPKNYESVNDFLNIYKDPCFLMCCDCQTVFNEQEDFPNHPCIEIAVEKINIIKEEARVDVVQDKEKITEVACETSENLVSENDRTLSVEKLVEVEKDTDPGDQVVNSKECSDSNSEVNIVENENEEENNTLVENSDNSVEESKEVENEALEMEAVKQEEGADDSIEQEEAENMDTVINKNEVSEDSDNKLNDQSETDEAPEGEPTLEDEEADEDEDEEEQQQEAETEVRKVPKVTLRLPKITTPYVADEEDEEDYQSEDSEKLTMEVEKENTSDIDVDVVNEQLENESDGVNMNQSGLCLPTAGTDVPVIELELEQPLDKFDIKLLLQKCLQSTVSGCLYCNHARKIAVNGRQLGLHAIAEHRYSAIVKSITAEELIPESFNTRIKESLDDLENVYFNLESGSTEGGVTFSHIFECFQCRYSTSVHKELYLHNRKLHAKSILLCTMCKTSFYSYCELICHLCPGSYVLEKDVQFRCCLCVSDDLPSAFRLMVHLRKKHHVCDVCLEMCHDQSRLSNHVWKHKLHHFCYRCGIAYRNKPDITKHLFWKHGTESVLCKKCLQKKWPHVYHFCIPPGSFSCEECTLSFARAVSLMVHKRLHAEVFPHACTEEGCTEKFVSKKLLAKHEFKHRQPVEEVKPEEEAKKEVVEEVKNEKDEVKEENKEVKEEEVVEEKVVEKPKPKVDVYDLPELNLSESDSSESEDELPKPSTTTADQSKPPESTGTILEIPHSDDILKTDEPTAEKKPDSEENPIPVLENIWDDFKNYQANIAKLDILTDVGNEDNDGQPEILTDIEPPLTQEIALRDHDYCAPTMDTLKEEEGLPQPANEKDTSADHDYCNANNKEKKDVSAPNNHKENNAKNSSDSSSDSDSSSCTCGSNCSCSSASSSSSSSSDSSESDSSSEEGRRRQQIRREKRRTKKTKKESESVTVDVEAVANDNTARPQNNQQQQPQPVVASEAPIRESDLETTESDTDEDFYDKEPHKLASKLQAEKREKLVQLAGTTEPYINGSMMDSRPSTPSLMTVDEKKPSKKKSKSKKKKKRKSSKHEAERPDVNNMNNYPLTLTLPKNSPVRSPSLGGFPVNMHLPPVTTPGESDSNTRASKRRRVPNKFYGYSSDEEGEKLTPVQQSLKMRKLEVPTPKSPLVVPPLTIKAAPSTPTVEPISIRMSSKPGEMKVQPLRLPFAKRMTPKLKPLKPTLPPPPAIAAGQDSNSDSNTTSSDDEPKMSINIGGPPPPPMGSKQKETPALYCYCRCPYDEVSEMIGCDSDDCAIEWFHFECVGIMVPPKGQWYCPDCRKKKQQRREAFQAQM